MEPGGFGIAECTRTCAVMSSQKKINSWARKRTSQDSSSYQTRLSAWRVKEDLNDSKSISKCGQNSTVEDYEGADDQAENALQIALRYFEKGPIKTSQNKEKHLKTVENVAWKNGLAPEGIDILLSVALSGKFGSAVNTRIFKCMIPATLISEDSVVKAVSWLCAGKCSGSTKVLFIVGWLQCLTSLITRSKLTCSMASFCFIAR